ncbi:dihydrofolate reductase [Ktedonosporobacter rubrisoli]|uniref:Dihydrofolate reductase n=1 Tax=Ktedonosporobacter rubrisoli TaxID=2509675 RepID=A0A4P6JKR9_KTERU|nr:dihydrofolate reductase family protein [Ktedonosporobacter rubrisoli]QBD75769.1 dihydrofolate reductase [Ktedonosporobacter rubrisoli]
MRKLIVTENISLDGGIETISGGEGHPSGGDDLAAVNREHMAAADAVLLGRVTYEEFAGYWPAQTNDTTGVSDYLNRTIKYVVSSSLSQPSWQNTKILRGSLTDEVMALKQSPGKDIVATGSITLVHALIREKLVDAYRLFVYPVVSGQGRRLFPDGITSRLQLVETRTFHSGIVLLSYQVMQTARAGEKN